MKRRSLAAAPLIAQLVLVGFPMSYWAAAGLEPRREQLALRCLGLAGYETYFPWLREHRISHGRRIEIRPPALSGLLFPYRRGAMVRHPLEHRCHRPDQGRYPAGARR